MTHQFLQDFNHAEPVKIRLPRAQWIPCGWLGCQNRVRMPHESLYPTGQKALCPEHLPEVRE